MTFKHARIEEARHGTPVTSRAMVHVKPRNMGRSSYELLKGLTIASGRFRLLFPAPRVQESPTTFSPYEVCGQTQTKVNVANYCLVS